MLAGLQGTGKTTLAGKLGRWLKAQRHAPLLVAADLQRPNAVQQLQVVGGQAGVEVFAPEPGNGVGDPVAVARAAIEHARRRRSRRRRRRHRGSARRRRRHDGAGRRDPGRGQPGRDPVRRRRDDRPGRGRDGRGVPRRRRVHRRRADQARRRCPRRCGAVGGQRHRPADPVRLDRGEARGLRRLPPRADGLADPRHGRRAQPDRAGRADLRDRRDRRGWPSGCSVRTAS